MLKGNFSPVENKIVVETNNEYFSCREYNAGVTVLSSVSHNELVVIGLLNNETSVIEFINSRRFVSNERRCPLTPRKHES